MAEMRWLLNVAIPPDQELTPAAFAIWLRNLDEPDDTPPVCVTTIDELLTVLILAWQQRRPVVPLRG